MLTVLSYGGGQDSTAILYKLIYDKAFYNKHVSGTLLVVMAATGNEHDYTNKHVTYISRLCRARGIKFAHVTPDMGFHSNGWHTLQQQYSEKKSVGSKAFVKSCTDKLKIVPIYKFIGDYLEKNYGYEAGRKKEFYSYAEQYGKLKMLIGIAKGEEQRMITNDDSRPKWMQRCVDIQYPLIDESMDRAGCQSYIASTGHSVPMPSNCKMCPYMSEQELLWLHRFDKPAFDEWTRFEDAKLEKYMDKGDKNVGVWGKYDKKAGKPVRLQDILVVAESKHGHMTDDELNDYKMSHGHCVKSKY